jgi:hypothetical protein
MAPRSAPLPRNCAAARWLPRVAAAFSPCCRAARNARWRGHRAGAAAYAQHAASFPAAAHNAGRLVGRDGGELVSLFVILDRMTCGRYRCVGSGGIVLSIHLDGSGYGWFQNQEYKTTRTCVNGSCSNVMRRQL